MTADRLDPHAPQGTQGAIYRPLVLPKVTGPIERGRRGWPFQAYFGAIAETGYVEEEFFFRGEALGYEPVGEHGPDGRWRVQEAGAQPYCTRMLVRRPVDPAKFNGTVVVEWANVTSGYEISFADPPGLYDGFAYVAISAQRVGLHGIGPSPMGLIAWDQERYGKLSIPGDSLSFDIFTQAGWLLGPDRPTSEVDPLRGLAVNKLIAIGGSQSASRLRSYYNAVHDRVRVYDAFMMLASFGSATGFDDEIFDPSDEALTRRIRTASCRIRDDLLTPVMVVNTESETMATYPVRQPDTDRFRYWEIAGSSHVSTGSARRALHKLQRDEVAPAFMAEFNASDVMALPTTDAAISHVDRWIAGGPPPPAMPPIEVATGDVPAIVRDVHGNAVGGVRLPELEVPVARYLGLNEGDPLFALMGQTVPFGPEKLRQLYPTHSDYVRKVRDAAARARQAGVILPYREAEYVDAAEQAPIPPTREVT
jgi:hypothetical protein